VSGFQLTLERRRIAYFWSGWNYGEGQGKLQIKGRRHSQLSGQHRSNPFASPAQEALVARFSELDSVDRSVVRSAAAWLIELVHEKLSLHDIELTWLLRTKNGVN